MAARDHSDARTAAPAEFASIRDFYRVLALVGVTGVTVFTWIHRYAAPEAHDPVWQRVVVGCACLWLFLASGRVSIGATRADLDDATSGLRAWCSTC